MAAAAAGLGLAGGAALAQGRVEPIRALATADVRRGTEAALDRLARGIGEATHGRVRMTVDQAAAADTAAVVEPVRRGEATLGLVRVADVAALAPEVALLAVPFLFRDQTKALALLEATWLGPLLNDELRKHGLEPLGFLDAGPLRLAGQAAAPALGGGQQVAARSGGLRAAAFRALGLEPVAPGASGVPLAELRTDDLATATAAGGGPFSQVVEAPHAHDLVVLVANRERFADLPLDVRETMRTHVQEIATWQRGAVAQADALALAGLRQGGGRLVALPEDQLGPARERVRAAAVAVLGDTADASIVRTLLAYAD